MITHLFPLSREVSVYNDYSTLGLGDTAAHNKGKCDRHPQALSYLITRVNHTSEEHHEIKQLIHKADTTSVSSPEYDEVITKAVTTFLIHAKEEEDEQHPTIRQKLSPQDNDVRTSVPDSVAVGTDVP